MTTTVRPTAAKPVPRTATRPPMDSARKAALVAGVAYLVTFASSIAAKFFLIDPVLANADFITRAGTANALLAGTFLDMINALACIATAVALFPIIKRQSESFALGFVTTRLLEAATIAVGIVSLLAVVTLNQQGSELDAGAVAVTGNALAATYNWTFLFGPNVMAACNAALFGTVLYRSRLVPRAIPVMGLIGAPLLLASAVAAWFGWHDLNAPTHFIAVMPIFFWELSVGIYMATKGFKASPITSGVPAAVSASAAVPAV